MEIGDWARAESLLNQAIEAAPDDAEPRRYMAEALWHRGAASQALEQIEQAVELDDRDASLAVRSGEMLLAAGQTENAMMRAELAIRLDPKLSSAWALRGRVFWKRNEADRALADLQRALQYAPENPELLLDVAVLYRQRGQAARSLASIHQLLDTYPPGEEPQMPLYLEGQILAELGRPTQAATSLIAACRRGPPNADIYCQLAEAQAASGDYSAATVAAQQALAIDASHQASRELLRRMAAAAGPVEPQRR
jgi:Tfp pilus assembly protein PilF